MSKPTLRFATFLAPNMYPVYDFIAGYVGKELDLPVQLSAGGSFGEFGSDQADIGFICGWPYVELMDQADPTVELLAAPVLQGERFGGRPIYFSDVIVRHNSPYQTFDDLRGKTWSYNEPESHSGYHIVRHAVASRGVREGFFGKTVRAGWHQRSIRLVCEGEVDAAAVDCQVLAIEMRDHPELKTALRVVEALGPSPIQPVVAARRLPDSLKADVRAVLLSMGDDPQARVAFAQGFIERFVTVTDSDYDKTREIRRVSHGVRLDKAQYADYDGILV